MTAVERVFLVHQSHRRLAAPKELGEGRGEGLVDGIEGGQEALARLPIELADGVAQLVDRLGDVGALGDEESVALLVFGVLFGCQQVDRSQSLEQRLAAFEIDLELGQVGGRLRRPLGQIFVELLVELGLQMLCVLSVGRALYSQISASSDADASSRSSRSSARRVFDLLQARALGVELVLGGEEPLLGAGARLERLLELDLGRRGSPRSISALRASSVSPSRPQPSMRSSISAISCEMRRSSSRCDFQPLLDELGAGRGDSLRRSRSLRAAGGSLRLGAAGDRSSARALRDASRRG